jgi:hypothetical protein
MPRPRIPAVELAAVACGTPAALADAPEAFTSRLADREAGGERRWRERLALPGSRNLVAMHRDHPVGVASAVPVSAELGELHSVWVGPRARGLWRRRSAAERGRTPGEGVRHADAEIRATPCQDPRHTLSKSAPHPVRIRATPCRNPRHALSGAGSAKPLPEGAVEVLVTDGGDC